MNLESPKISVSKSPQDVFDFLSDIKNFEALMPENISKFEVLEEDKFLFALKGMPEIRLKIQETTPSEKIVLGSTSDKFPFTLTGTITKIDDNSSEVQLLFDGKFNPMMAMMIKSPITNFMGTLTSNIEKI